MYLTFSFKTKSHGTDPVYEEEYFDTEDFDWEYSPTIDDFMEFVLPSKEIFKGEERANYKAGLRYAEDYLDWEKLEEDEDFIDFLKEKYESKAYADYLEEKEFR